MSTRRNAKIAQAIRQVVSSVVLQELRDPRVEHVTVLGAEVAEDLRSAKVFVSVMGSAGAQRLAMHGLESSRGFVQSRIAAELQLRYTPVLSFALDQGVKQSAEVSRALRAALQPADEADELRDDDSPTQTSATDDADQPSLSTGEPR
ncbi:MAG: 30S ribosome-binding factor RbfA [Pirellulales bacterium]